ncbi:hypothetical protein FQR65_LT20911 [Abscondita terminalis]|nr:hypothetical protein FQR65_LT20911 [Abscondita terminalis]
MVTSWHGSRMDKGALMVDNANHPSVASVKPGSMRFAARAVSQLVHVNRVAQRAWQRLGNARPQTSSPAAKQLGVSACCPMPDRTGMIHIGCDHHASKANLRTACSRRWQLGGARCLIAGCWSIVCCQGTTSAPFSMCCATNSTSAARSSRLIPKAHGCGPGAGAAAATAGGGSSNAVPPATGQVLKPFGARALTVCINNAGQGFDASLANAPHLSNQRRPHTWSRPRPVPGGQTGAQARRSARDLTTAAAVRKACTPALAKANALGQVIWVRSMNSKDQA